jgi:hypothetical protein
LEGNLDGLFDRDLEGDLDGDLLGLPEGGVEEEDELFDGVAWKEI